MLQGNRGPTHRDMRARGGWNSGQHSESHAQVALHPSHQPNNNKTNKPAASSAEFTHDTHKSRCKHNTNKSRQRPQRLCGIYPRTHKSHCTIAPNTTQTKASNGCNDCAEFTHAPTVALHGRPKHNTNKKQPGNGRIDYAEFSHGGYQIPASKNVLKTSFSKGELGISHPFCQKKLIFFDAM